MGEIISNNVEEYSQTFFDNTFNIPVAVVTEVMLESFGTTVKVRTVFPHWEWQVKKNSGSRIFKIIIELPSKFKKIDENKYLILMERLNKKLRSLHTESLDSWSMDFISKKDAEKAHIIAVELLSSF